MRADRTRPQTFPPYLALLLASAAALAFPLPSTAQSPPADDVADATFEETSDVVVIEVPVNVTDRSGRPIRGLTKDDFEVYDGRERQEIVDFEVVDLETLIIEEKPGKRAEIEQALPAPARRHILLLFDLSFSNPSSVLKAREAARDFVLDSLHPTDLVAVATFSIDYGPRLVVTFTPDRAQLARAIDTLGAPRLVDSGLVQDPLRFLIEPPEQGANFGADPNDLQPGDEQRLGAPDPRSALQAHLEVLSIQFDKSQKAYERSRITSMTRSMAELARALDSVQGRKQVVYFSEGFDSRLLLGRRSDIQDRNQAVADEVRIMTGQHYLVDTDNIYGNSSLQGAVEEMLEQFRRADCAIQAVDIGGLRADARMNSRGRDVGKDALFYMANETGGELFEDANNLSSQLDEVLDRSNVTYLLSIQPEKLALDGSYHRLRVELGKDLPRGTRVSHRSGYYAPRPFGDLSPLEKSLLASDAIASASAKSELDLNVLAAPFRATEGTAYVPVIIEVAGEKLLVGQENPRLDVEFYAYVTDSRGNMRDFFTQVVGLGLEGADGRENLAATGLKYYGHMELPTGDYLIRVLVRNGTTGRTGVATLPLDVPAFDGDQPVVLPPFFLERPGQWVMVRESASDGEQRSIVYPFTIKGQPYIPAARPQLTAGGEAAQFCLVGYNLADGELHLASRIFTEDGRDVGSGDLAFIERTVTGFEGVDKLLASFSPPSDLDAGGYQLQVTVTDPSTGTSRINTIPFSVPN